MSELIINPNAPPKPAWNVSRGHIEAIMETMRMIAAYREQYLSLHAMLQNDGTQEEITATQVERIHTSMQAVAENLLEFIIWGKK